MTKSGGRRTLKVSLQHEKSGEIQKLILNGLLWAKQGLNSPRLHHFATLRGVRLGLFDPNQVQQSPLFRQRLEECRGHGIG